MIQKVNGFLLTRNINHKFIVKVRSFPSVKVKCMTDYVKPTINDFDPEHIIIHVGTNDLNSERTASQISNSIINLQQSLKSINNTVTISLIVPRNDELDNKAHEVNNRLVNMCKERNISYLDHIETISLDRHLNESNLHLNRYGTLEFAKKFSKYLCESDRWSFDDSSISKGIYDSEFDKNLYIGTVDIQTDVSDSIDVHSENEYVCENEASIISNNEPLDSFANLNNVRQKNSSRLIIAQLNINSLRNKFDSFSQMVKDNVGILLISETKIDSSFPTAQFNMNGFTTYRRDRNINGGGIILYVREDIPSSFLKIDTSIEALYVEINVRKKKWLIGCSYNPHKGLITQHLTEIGKDLDIFSANYDNFILLGDFNSEPKEKYVKGFCHVHNCKNIIKENTCFKNPDNPSCRFIYN